MKEKKEAIQRMRLKLETSRLLLSEYIYKYEVGDKKLNILKRDCYDQMNKLEKLEDELNQPKEKCNIDQIKELEMYIRELKREEEKDTYLLRIYKKSVKTLVKRAREKRETEKSLREELISYKKMLNQYIRTEIDNIEKMESMGQEIKGYRKNISNLKATVRKYQTVQKGGICHGTKDETL